MSDDRTPSFSERTLTFFDDLEENNTREFWTRNLDTFTTQVKAPMASLLESLPERYQSFRVFRMNRDVRFSKDKSPYKTSHAAIHDTEGIDHYLQVGAGGLLAAAGIYWMEPEPLQSFRAAIDDNRTGRALERLLGKLKSTSLSINDMGVGSLKTAPRGYPRDHPRVELLRMKGLVGHRTLTGSAFHDPDTVRHFVLETFDLCTPLTRWLRRNTQA